jgi:hypothetical protein
MVALASPAAVSAEHVPPPGRSVDILASPGGNATVAAQAIGAPLADHLFAAEGTAFSPLSSADVQAVQSARSAPPAALSSGPLTITSLTPPTGAVTNQFTGASVVAVFTDTDPNFTATDFTATISWGDGASDTSPSVNCFIIPGANNTFEVVGQHLYTHPGTELPFSVTITDPNGAQATDSGHVSVFNSPLSFVSLPSFSPVEGQDTGQVSLATFQVGSSTASPANLTAEVHWGDGTTTSCTIANGGIVPLGGGMYQVVGHHTYPEESPPSSLLFFSVEISDKVDPPIRQSRSQIVGDASLNITSLTPPSGLTEGVPSGQLTLATFTDSSPRPDINDYSALIDWGDGAPELVTAASGGIVANQDGSFSVVGSHTYFSVPVFFAVTVFDVGGSSASAFGAPSVTDAPLTLISIQPPTNLVEGQGTGPLTLATFSDANPSPNILDYSATVNWGDGSSDFLAPFNGGIVANSDGTFSVIDSHIYADAVPGMNFSVTIMDAGGATTGSAATVTVTDPPLTLSATMNTVVANQPFTATVATFSDYNLTGDVSEYTATIHWGDGETTSGSVVQNGGSFDVVGTHTYKKLGNDSVTVTVTDDGAPTTVTASVQVVALLATGETITATEAKVFHGEVATFQSANLSARVGDFSATIDWGDGHTTTGVVVSNGGNTFGVLGAHSYADEGGPAIQVTIEDNTGDHASAPSSAQVVDAPLIGGGQTRSAVEGTAFTTTIAALQDTNPTAQASDFMVSIDWGDGQTSTAAVQSLGNGHFDIIGSHTYAEAGPYFVTVNVQDEGGASLTLFASVTVADAPLRGSPKDLTASSGQMFQGTVAIFTDGNVQAPLSDFFVTIDWGNGDTTYGNVQSTGPGQFTVAGNETYAAPGAFTITVTIADIDGSVLTLKGHVKVT